MASEAGSSENVIYSDLKYLTTIEELEKEAVANLGPMLDKTYSECVEKMKKIAEEHRIAKPILVIGIKHKEEAYIFAKEQLYPITERNLADFKKDAETIFESVPNVFVIDSLRFALFPILN